jgi:hypothetical protein
VSLVLLYALGMRENVTTIVTNSESGVQIKEKTIVTPGGPFIEGLDVSHNCITSLQFKCSLLEFLSRNL